MLAWRMKMSGLRPGARTRNIGRWSAQRAEIERREDQEAAGFARKLDNAEEDPLMALSISLCSQFCAQWFK